MGPIQLVVFDLAGTTVDDGGAHSAATLAPYRHTRVIASVADLPALFAS